MGVGRSDDEDGEKSVVVEEVEPFRSSSIYYSQFEFCHDTYTHIILRRWGSLFQHSHLIAIDVAFRCISITRSATGDQQF